MARPFPNQWGRRMERSAKKKKTNLIAWALTFQPIVQMSSSLEGEAWGSCGPLRRKLKGLAQGRTQILDN